MDEPNSDQLTPLALAYLEPSKRSEMVMRSLDLAGKICSDFDYRSEATILADQAECTRMLLENTPAPRLILPHQIGPYENVLIQFHHAGEQLQIPLQTDNSSEEMQIFEHNKRKYKILAETVEIFNEKLVVYRYNFAFKYFLKYSAPFMLWLLALIIG